MENPKNIKKNLFFKLARLKQTVLDLENSIRIKDSQMDSMRRDNERLVQELRKQQRNNRSIKRNFDFEYIYIYSIVSLSYNHNNIITS